MAPLSSEEAMEVLRNASDEDVDSLKKKAEVVREGGAVRLTREQALIARAQEVVDNTDTLRPGRKAETE